MGGKRYGFMIVDDFSRFTWVLFLSHKDEAFNFFINFCKRVENEEKIKISFKELIVGENLKMFHLNNFVKKIASPITFLVKENLNKMVL